MIKEGDYVLIITSEGKKYIKRVDDSRSFSTHRGTLDYKLVLENGYGRYGDFLVVKPSLYDVILYGIDRITQIVYPKDLGLIASRLSIESAKKVLDTGTGSGASALFFSKITDGTVFTYEREEKFYKIAKKNIERFGEISKVKMFLGDVKEVLKEDNFEAAFIDLREPWNFLGLFYESLVFGGKIAFLLPTANQVIELLKAIEEHKGFIDIEVSEILVRGYKTIPQRFRPEDRMVAHTGYLVFAVRV